MPTEHPTRFLAWCAPVISGWAVTLNLFEIAYDDPNAALEVIEAHHAAGRLTDAEKLAIEHRLATEVLVDKGWLTEAK